MSGTALLYILSQYTTVERLILLEKNESVGSINSAAWNNSQTLHVGDIETNYSIDKVKQVRLASMMVRRYADHLEEAARRSILFPTPKMVLAIGRMEVERLEKRYVALKSIFPRLEKLDRTGITKIEPAVMEGRDPEQPIMALFNPEGYAVHFGELAKSFVKESRPDNGRCIEVQLQQKVLHIAKRLDGSYELTTKAGLIIARVVVVDADSYSLGFAKALGYGQNFSLIPIAGSFYFSAKKLQGKVYTLQEPKLPFAAVHGDPDILISDTTRWGPTAEFIPVLESRNARTVFDYFKTSGLNRWRTWKSFFVILLEPIRFWYLARNILYILPVVGKYFFLSSVRKIVPSMRGRDLKRARGFGGMRLQRVDITKSELQLGEGKIVGDSIIFNMTPSPGASVCLYNAWRDTEKIMEFLAGQYHFDRERLVHDLFEESGFEKGDISLKQSYSS